MAAGGHEDVEQRGRQQPLPGEAHELVDAHARQRAAHPDEDDARRRSLGQEPEQADRRRRSWTAQSISSAPTTRTLKSTKPTISDFKKRQRSEHQTGSARARMTMRRHDGDDPAAGPMPRLAGVERDGIERGDAERSRGSAPMSKGAFQPPRKRTTVSAERMNTLTYSAKKKKPKRMPLYSVAKPATISRSASVRSNGVRLPSAVGGDEEDEERQRLLEDVPVEEAAAWFIDDGFRLQRAGQQHDADDASMQRQLVADDLGRRAQAAQQRVLVEARPAGHHQADHAQAADGEEVEQPDVHVAADQAGREGHDQQRHHARPGRRRPAPG